MGLTQAESILGLMVRYVGRRWLLPPLLCVCGNTILQALLLLSAVETSDHTISFYISDGFSALLCTAVMEHPVVQIHMASWRYQLFSPPFPFLFLFFVRLALHNCWKICRFSISLAKVDYFTIYKNMQRERNVYSLSVCLFQFYIRNCTNHI